jgi:hypothetical protein
MPKTYKVWCTVSQTYSYTIEVQAESPEDAKAQAELIDPPEIPSGLAAEWDAWDAVELK